MHDSIVESARALPGTRTSCGDPISSLSDGLITYDDLFIPALHQPIALESSHELVERGAGTVKAEFGGGIANHSARLLARKEHAEGEELQMRDIGQPWLVLHNAG
jgi:hypothetical protein